jgi:hypothetical protein
VGTRGSCGWVGRRHSRKSLAQNGVNRWDRICPRSMWNTGTYCDTFSYALSIPPPFLCLHSYLSDAIRLYSALYDRILVLFLPSATLSFWLLSLQRSPVLYHHCRPVCHIHGSQYYSSPTSFGELKNASIIFLLGTVACPVRVQMKALPITNGEFVHLFSRCRPPPGWPWKIGMPSTFVA